MFPYLVGDVTGIGDGVVVVAVAGPSATDTRDPALQRLHNSFLFFFCTYLSVFFPDSNFPPLKYGAGHHFDDTHVVTL